jgi:hypothetical protein
VFGYTKVPSSWTTLINNRYPCNWLCEVSWLRAIPIIDKHGNKACQLERRIAMTLPAWLRTARAINSYDFTTDQVRIFKKRNKEFEQILIPMDSLLKSGMLWWLGMMAHKSHCNSILRAHLSSFLSYADHLDTPQIDGRKILVSKLGRPFL